MRVLVVSDLHGNWAALRAVEARERADQVLCLGDLVDYGPSPGEIVRSDAPPLLFFRGRYRKIGA